MIHRLLMHKTERSSKSSGTRSFSHVPVVLSWIRKSRLEARSLPPYSLGSAVEAHVAR
jgi:hypothetical protein